MHILATGHETPDRRLIVSPVGFGVDWIAQVAPFQRSARDTNLPAVLRKPPTAVQALDVGQDTALRESPCTPTDRTGISHPSGTRVTGSSVAEQRQRMASPGPGNGCRFNISGGRSVTASTRQKCVGDTSTWYGSAGGGVHGPRLAAAWCILLWQMPPARWGAIR